MNPCSPRNRVSDELFRSAENQDHSDILLGHCLDDGQRQGFACNGKTIGGVSPADIEQAAVGVIGFNASLNLHSFAVNQPGNDFVSRLKLDNKFRKLRDVLELA